MKTFNVEITDTFGGESNYSWVERYTVQAKSMLGAIRQVSRLYGGHWRKQIECGDYAQYKMTGACIVAFINYSEN